VNPSGGVIDVNGTLYGSTTAVQGGSVYQISTSGAYEVLYQFPAEQAGGPIGRLLYLNGTLYGETLYGGSNCYSNGGCGTIYSVTMAGKKKIVYSFGGPAAQDGWLPSGGLINLNGVLYGTTFTGGEGTCFLGSGCGIVFSLTTGGKETVLYRFDSEAGGQNPDSALTDVNGVLYGTTEWGGGGSCDVDSGRFVGCGTVFSLTTSGALQVLHSFVGGHDGANPGSDLTHVNGALYGTTYAGGTPSGCRNTGCGTIFSL
jgi:uncharacterized repeat protein (TIGR03803 family)